ncbi:unnamed protein product [Amoebophrya sp. A120]|nr:unnamed protein product [Amoebophrya sp. A120]|eukprot:GSA120T00002067001.1
MSAATSSSGGKKPLKTFSVEEVEKHNKLGDLWITVDNKVYDLSKFANAHPGGKHILLDVAGQDATKHFYAFHATAVMEKYHKKLCIGTVEGKEEQIYHPLDEDEDGATQATVVEQSGGISADKVVPAKMDLKTAPVEQLLKHPLLSRTPFGEPASLKKFYATPYFTDSHLRFRLGVREFFHSVLSECDELEDSQEYVPQELWEQFGTSGIFACSIGLVAMPYAKKLNLTLPGGLKPEEFDFFHEQILHEESSRMLPPSVSDGIFAGFNIGLTPIINFYHGADKEELVSSILLGKKKVCLAITGPEAGSDVANHQTKATVAPDGKHFIVRGLKKWITGGCQADYFVTAVRTGGAGLKGITMLLIKREEGITTKQLSTSYGKSAATALVQYEDAKVPMEGRIMAVKKGDGLNKGFQLIMLNFNHERWMIVCKVVGAQRSVIADCLQWLTQRQAFGRPLTDQPVLRFKFGQMAAAMESLQAYLDYVTFQMKTFYDRVRDDPKTWKTRDYLAGEIGLLKYQATRVSTLIADNGCQLFGGRAVTRTGMGKKMERFNRIYKISSIYGGSEEIMADLGVRQALREWSPEDKLRAKL